MQKTGKMKNVNCLYTPMGRPGSPDNNNNLQVAKDSWRKIDKRRIDN